MPTYTMINIDTGKETDMILSLAEREDLLAAGKYKQKLSTAKFISGTGYTFNKAGNGWKDVLKKVKSGAAKSNTIKD